MTDVLPGNKTGLNVLPEGDHIKAMFVPKGSRALGGRLIAAGGVRDYRKHANWQLGTLS